MSAPLVLMKPATSKSPTALRVPSCTPYVRLTDCATCVMTDFRCDAALTTEEGTSVDQALNEMFRAGVHSLLVTDSEHVLGLLTAYDIQRHCSHKRRGSRFLRQEMKI